MNKCFVVVSTLLSLLWLSGCKKDNDTSALNNQVNWTQVSLAESYTHPYIKEHWGKEELEQPIFWSHIDVLFPETSSTKLKTAIEKISTTLAENLILEKQLVFHPNWHPDTLLTEILTKEKEGYIGDMDFFIEQNKRPTKELVLAVFTYISDVCDSLYYNDKGVVSIARIRQTYLGGTVHGLDNIQAFNFNLSSGDQITPSSVFRDPKSKDLLALVQAELLTLTGASTAEELALLGFHTYEVEELFIAPNLFFTDDELVLYYNPYEIGIHSLGSIELSIPYSRLKPYLTERYQFLAESI